MSRGCPVTLRASGREFRLWRSSSPTQTTPHSDVSQGSAGGRCATLEGRSGAHRGGGAAEDAERVPGRVGVDVERLVRVAGPVEEQPGPEGQRAGVLPLERLPGGHGEVEVQLLRHAGPRPRRGGEVLDLLEGELAAAGLRSTSQSRPRSSSSPSGRSSPGR